MIYTLRNAAGATIYDVDRKEKIGHILQIDTAAGDVECYHHPFRLKPRADEPDTFTLRFSSIYPITGGGPRPCLFHCYGRVEA